MKRFDPEPMFPRPRETAADMERWLAIVQAVLSCGRELRRKLANFLAGSKSAETDLLLLWTCRQGPPEGVPQHQLASSVGLSPAQVSGLVERLRRGGQLACRRSPHDRRRQLWSLTSAGQEKLQRMFRDLEELAQGIQAQLSVPQQAELIAVLQRLGAYPADEPEDSTSSAADPVFHVDSAHLAPDQLLSHVTLVAWSTETHRAAAEETP